MAEEAQHLIGNGSWSPQGYGALTTPSLTDLSLSSEDSLGVNDEQHTLSFLDVSYSIPSGCRKTEMTILKSLSGIMKPGLNAIMGPTGSGKTTLLDILANRKAKSRVHGRVLYNSHTQRNCYFTSGYVVQDDVVSGTLTVRENLYFSAALRLPSQMSMSERRRRVDKVLRELQLRECADTKMGTEFIRGVSGGERKRTNIGMELIIEPQVLFLDEPTTGLDAHTAVSVIKILKGLTENKNRIVVMSIHQPRYSIFKLFDTLTLLSLGNLVYHGPAGSSLDYFKSIGYDCEDHDNPADFFLDIIYAMEQGKSSQSSGKYACSTEAVSMKKLDLSDAFEESTIYHRTQNELQPLMQNSDTEVDGSSYSEQYATGIFWQCLVVGYRLVLKMWRNPMTNIAQTLVMMVLAVIVGGIYFQRPDTPRGLQDRLGVLFFVVMGQVFSNLAAVELFIKDRAVFLHETSGGYYRVSVYFLATVLTDLIVLRLLPLSVFCAITYFMIGLETDVTKFFIYYLTLAQVTLSGASIAFAFSALVSVFAVANLLVSLVFILYMLFGGFLIGLSSLPVWINWMKYISIFRYAIEALACNELKGKVYSEVMTPDINGTIHLEKCMFSVKSDPITNHTLCVANGDSMLEFQGYNHSWIWYDQIALCSHALLWLCLAYIILRAVKAHYKQYK